MPENEFEKEVKQKMQELTLTPSGKVWETVSVNIGQQKKIQKKTAIIFYLFVFFINCINFFNSCMY